MLLLRYNSNFNTIKFSFEYIKFFKKIYKHFKQKKRLSCELALNLPSSCFRFLSAGIIDAVPLCMAHLKSKQKETLIIGLCFYRFVVLSHGLFMHNQIYTQAYSFSFSLPSPSVKTEFILSVFLTHSPKCCDHRCAVL